MIKISIYTIIKENVTAADVAEYFGLKKSGKLYQCPFHNDNSPSMQVDERYYCHGCGATGDVIDLACRLFNMGSYTAAKYIAVVFGINTDKEIVEITEIPLKAKNLRDEKNETILKLIEYEKILNQLLPIFAPKPDDTKMSQAFLFTQNTLAKIDDILYHIYQNPTDEEIKLLMEKSNEIMEEGTE